MKKNSWFPSVLLAAGLFLLWAGERVVEAATTRGALDVLGAVALLSALALRQLKVPKGKEGRDGQAREIERVLLALHGLAVFAVLLYLWQSDLYTRLVGQSLESGWPKVAGSVAVLWPALLASALLPTLLVEMSYAAMARAPTLEVRRVREAMYSGLALAFALTFAFATAYVTSERDGKWDLAYFRITKAGESAKKLAASLDEKLEVTLFFPPGSDVLEPVKGYFDELKADAPMIAIEVLDHALEPGRAKELGVSGNGTVVLKKGQRKESLYIGTELEKARPQLKSLDADVQKKLLTVAKTKRTVYLTTGHGERGRDPVNGTDMRATIDKMETVLKALNYEVRQLSSAEGLGAEVPKDAAAVFILGPKQPFTDGEAATVAAYGARGGKLFIALDPDSGHDFAELLKPLGLTFKPELLANDASYVRLGERQSKADRANLVTRTYSSHPSMAHLSRAELPVVFIGAGAVEELPQRPPGLELDMAVRLHPMTWSDANKNLEPDVPPEVRKAWGVVAAVSKRAASNRVEDEMRALVLGDSDSIADVFIPVYGNQYLVIDGLNWLTGDEALSGSINTETDVPLPRGKQQDALLFYGTSFAMPLAIVGLGLLVRRRPKKPTEKKEAKS